MVLQIKLVVGDRTFTTLGVKILSQIGPLLHLGPIITLFCAFYNCNSSHRFNFDKFRDEAS